MLLEGDIHIGKQGAKERCEHGQDRLDR
jgi:hypothetical protein